MDIKKWNELPESSAVQGWPYTNLHALNLDWIINTTKKFAAEISRFEDNVTEEVTDFEESVTVKIGEFEGTMQEYTGRMDVALASVDEKIEYIDNFFSSLDVQQEINNKLNSMSADGSLAALLKPFADAYMQQDAPGIISAWLAAHITEPEGVVIDSSLTVPGAAADAAAVGKHITELNNALNNKYTNAINKYEFTSGYYNVSGAFVTNGNYRTTSNNISEAVASVTVSGDTYTVDVYRWNKSSNAFSRVLGVSNHTFEHQWFRYKIAVRKIDGTSMADADFTNNVSFNQSTGVWNEVSDLKENSENLFALINGQHGHEAEVFASYIQGAVNASGVLSLNARQITTDFLRFPTGGTLRYKCDAAYGCYIMEFTITNGSYTRTRLVGGNALQEVVLSDISADKFYVFSGYNESGISPDASGQYHIYYTGLIDRPTLALENNEMVITGRRSRYTFKRVTDPSIRIDTWRLYKGEYYQGYNSFTAWENSDAEGAIKIVGEDDFVSGYHGDEIMESISAYMNGTSIDVSGSYSGMFDKLTVYVKSLVYHCNTSALANSVAFTRYKKLDFELDKVTVSNCYVPVSQLNIQQARLAMFQCVKTSNNVPVFTNYSVNTDYKDYAVADVSTDRPGGSALMTEANLETIYANINFKYVRGSDQYYSGTVTDMTSRIKFYFDTIAAERSVQSGEKITSEFTFSAK